MSRLLLIVVITNLVSISLSYPNGAPTKSCNGLVPSPKGHKANPSKKPSPYTLSTETLESSLRIQVFFGTIFQYFMCGSVFGKAIVRFRSLECHRFGVLQCRSVEPVTTLLLENSVGTKTR